jgi:hypothetical protein
MSAGADVAAGGQIDAVLPAPAIIDGAVEFVMATELIALVPAVIVEVTDARLVDADLVRAPVLPLRVARTHLRRTRRRVVLVRR